MEFHTVSSLSYLFLVILLISLSYLQGWDIKLGKDNIMINKESRLCPSVINGREIYVNLLVINRGGYDVIADMDRLSTFHVVID